MPTRSSRLATAFASILLATTSFAETLPTPVNTLGECIYYVMVVELEDPSLHALAQEHSLFRAQNGSLRDAQQVLESHGVASQIKRTQPGKLPQEVGLYLGVIDDGEFCVVYRRSQSDGQVFLPGQPFETNITAFDQSRFMGSYLVIADEAPERDNTLIVVLVGGTVSLLLLFQANRYWRRS